MIKIFISWSGDDAGQVGSKLKQFLDNTFAGHVQAFLSHEDIAPGQRFESVIATGLGEASLGILLVTSENQNSPWLLFEAGALATKSATGSVIPVLLGLNRAALQPPLNQFQNVVGADRAGFLKICQRIMEMIEMPEPSFTMLFELQWPALQAAIEGMPSGATRHAPPVRTVEDMVSEILLTVNSLAMSPKRSADLSHEKDAAVVRAICNAMGLPARKFSIKTKDGVSRATIDIPELGLADPQLDKAAEAARGSELEVKIYAKNGIFELDGEGGWTLLF